MSWKFLLDQILIKLFFVFVATSVLLVSSTNAEDEKNQTSEKKSFNRLIPYSEPSIIEGKKLFTLFVVNLIHS